MGQGLTNLIEKECGDGMILIEPYAYASITQGTWVYAANSSYHYNGYFTNTTTAISDQINYNAYLSKGLWTVSIEGFNTTTSGIVSLLLDEVTPGTPVAQQSSVDMYASANNVYCLKTFPDPLNITESKVWCLGLQLTAQYPSATDYCLYMYHLVIRRIK